MQPVAFDDRRDSRLHAREIVDRQGHILVDAAQGSTRRCACIRIVDARQVDVNEAFALTPAAGADRS